MSPVPLRRRTAPADRIRVVVVEDSLVQRAHLVALLEADGDIEVVGQAGTAIEAVRVVADKVPAVVTLDLHLPDRAGLYVIEQVMASNPVAIVVLSSTVTGPRSAAAVEALVAGAMDAVPKPSRWTPVDEQDFVHRVRLLSKAVAVRHPRGRRSSSAVAHDAEARRRDALAKPGNQSVAGRSVVPGRRSASGLVSGPPVVALAASTGGPAALAQVLAGLGGLDAPVLVVQHLHDDFVAGLVSWMARVSALPVDVAVHNERVVPGRVYIAPGGAHLRIGPDRRLVLDAEPPSLHRPSADELFASVAAVAGPAGIGVVMTGMGEDGARGLLAMREAGGRTIGQEAASCAVFGMPRAAGAIGAVTDFVPLDGLAPAVARAVRELR